MCKPHKALRMTIKVHLKTEEKKRAAAEAATPTVSEPVETPAPAAPIPSEQNQVEETPAADAANIDHVSAGAGATDPNMQVDEVRCMQIHFQSSVVY